MQDAESLWEWGGWGDGAVQHDDGDDDEDDDDSGRANLVSLAELLPLGTRVCVKSLR